MSISGDTLSLIDKIPIAMEFGAAVIFILSSLWKEKYAKGCHFLDSRHHEAMTKTAPPPKSFSTCILSMRERRTKEEDATAAPNGTKLCYYVSQRVLKLWKSSFALELDFFFYQRLLLSSRAKQWLVLCLTYNHRDISQLHGTNEVRERKTKRIEESTEKPPGRAKIQNI